MCGVSANTCMACSTYFSENMRRVHFNTASTCISTGGISTKRFALIVDFLQLLVTFLLITEVSLTTFQNSSIELSHVGRFLLNEDFHVIPDITVHPE